ncbi:hypothetical protein [Actinoplanes sp. NPDC023714]|uniref:hypothetical protein n=1 Tax=Actinoplanes sp. NPDC023714 TaxID=3154322 RepID=UPI0033E89B5C
MRGKLAVAGGVLLLAVAGCGGGDADTGSGLADPVGRGFPIVTPPSGSQPSSSSELSPIPVEETAGAAGMGPAGTGTARPSATPGAVGAPSRSDAAVTRPAAEAPSPSPAVISGYSACSEKGGVALTATFADGYDYRHVFLDTDGDPSTGYRVDGVAGGFGAEYMIEDDGLFKSSGADWSWKEVGGGGPLVSEDAGTYRWRVKPAYAGDEVVFGAATDGGDEVTSPVVPVEAC